jgi:hypothetical protein
MAEDQVVITILGKDKNATRLFEKVGKAAEKTGKQVEKGLGKKLQDVGKGATKAGKLLQVSPSTRR